MRRFVWVAGHAVLTAGLVAMPVTFDLTRGVTASALAWEAESVPRDFAGFEPSVPSDLHWAPPPLEDGAQDFVRLVDGLRTASVTWVSGHRREASALMEKALEAYVEMQTVRYPQRTLTPIEQEVLAIRDLVRAHASYPISYRAAVLDPRVRVTLFDQREGWVTVRRPLANRPWTLYLSPHRVKALEAILTELSQPGRRLEDGPQPLWAQFLAAFPGHMRPWTVLASPSLDGIRFMDHRHQTAIVWVRLGDAQYEAVECRKVNGAWRWIRVLRHVVI